MSKFGPLQLLLKGLVDRLPPKSGLASTETLIDEPFRSNLRYRFSLRSYVAGEVSSGRAIKFTMSCEGEGQSPPFKVDGPTAVEFLSAVLASRVGTKIHEFLRTLK
eukprot:4005253-Pleurochrysis_carterae.AAC.1